MAQSDPGQDGILRRWSGIGALPVAAALLVTMNGLYMLLVAFGNITNFETNHEFVRRVLAMDTTNFGAEPGAELDDEIMWRAITEPWIQTAAYIVIIVWEVLTASVLLAAVVAWIRERRGGFPVARALSSVGLVMVLLLFFGGFIVIGGEWFQMWRSVEWNGLEPAFRNSVLALLTLVLIHLPSPAWERRRDPARA